MAQPDLALLFAAYALLNVLLTGLVLGVRPRRTANVVAAVVFVGNALIGVWRAAQLSSDAALAVLDPLNTVYDHIVNLPTYVALVVLPFLFPRRLLSRRWERGLLGGAVLWVVGLTALFFGTGQGLPFHLNPRLLGSGLLLFTPYYIGLALGTVVLLDTYVSAPSPILRDQARFLLAAYGMKVANILGLFVADTYPGALVPTSAWSVPPELVLGWASLLLVAVVAVPLALAASRWRARGQGAPRPWGHDAFVLLAIPVGFLLLAALPLTGPITALSDMEYMLLRPLLFAYGILQYQVLEVDLRTRRGTIAATYLTGLVAAFLVASLSLQSLGVQGGLATGIGFVVALGLGGVLAWPVLRALLHEAPERPDPRGADLYRAALEEALAGADGHKATEDRILRSLRARLQISDREHEVLEADVRASFGKPADGLAPGALFLGRYRIASQLGEGGFGRAFLARDEQVGRAVVLKAARLSDASEAQRVLREARLLARLHHPNIVTVFDVEQVGHSCFLVLEHVEGGSLADRLRQGPLPVAESAGIVGDLLAALEAAHGEGMLHRDVKPANILLTGKGKAKLADFGVARAPTGSATVSAFSITGTQPGSLPYMSPEQVRGRDLDARSDLYSVGVVWYEMLAGRDYLDLRGRAEFDARLAILEEKPKLPLPGVPDAVNKLLAECLAKDPAKRPASARAMRERLALAVPA